MKNKMKLICFLIISFTITTIIYRAFHELGHCLIAVLCGATVTNIDIFNGSMSYVGGSFNNIRLALLHISGVILPVIMCLIFLYAKEKVGFVYNMFVVMLYFNTIISVGALQAWVVVPLLGMYGTASADDDVIKFINVLDVHPMHVSISAIVFITVFIVVVLKRKHKPLSTQLSKWMQV